MQRLAREPWVSVIVLVFLVAAGTRAIALQVPETGGRFGDLVIEDPGNGLDVATTPIGSLNARDEARSKWEGFRATHGQQWSVYLDRRSGAPLLVEGNGIPWVAAQGATLESLASSLRAFIAGNRALLMANDSELVLDKAASGLLSEDVWQIVFDRAISGVPVAGERYVFTIGHGKLISFGSPRWSRIDASPVADIDAAEAKDRLSAYMKLTTTDVVTVASAPELVFIPLRASEALGGGGHGYYKGQLGSGYTSALAWRLTLRVEGEPGSWSAQIDAHTGAILSFVDDNMYVRVKGGVYPQSNDQICPSGCEQPNSVMPFADITINAVPQTATTSGIFTCSPAGSTAVTTLAGPYVRVVDTCGPISQSLPCASDLDVSTSGGTDCTVPVGASAGNTHAARSSFYHLNRIIEHARSWLPMASVPWLGAQLTDNVNLNQTCNAYWNGSSVNFFKSGGGCRNTGEIAGVFLHEWGHGLDENDGGYYDNPSEAYGDVTSFMLTHTSCLGRGFRQVNCGGNGNACLNCTGVRDVDWDQRADHTPATAAGFVATRCPAGAGPCGKEVHCEGYLAGETLWDLAARDLPASGLDQPSAWNVADRLWFKSRLGSGGNAYNCALPDSDGCSAFSWFQKLRAVDDDDGNLANGTPHAAAIFAAFDRHNIACGLASDPSNQNSATCPTLGSPTLTAAPNSIGGTVSLSWTAVPGAAAYRILRNDAGCDAAITPVTQFAGTSKIDGGLANGVPLFYTVQAVASNSACDGGLSNCQSVTPQPFVGVVSMDAGVYSCSSLITVTVTDGNIGAPPAAALTSTTEGTAQTVTLTRIAPGSTTYRGSIMTTANPPAADNLLSVHNNDTITATYIDASDGGGGFNIARAATASASCVVTGVRPVADGSFGTAMNGSRGDASGSMIDISWDVATCSSADHHILFGDLGSVASMTVTGSSCDLGTTGSASWTGVPPGDLWFVVVGDDNATTEGSWGTDGAGAQRGGNAVSGQCSVSTRDNSGACP